MRPYRTPCLPPWWARGGQAQTLAGHFLRTPSRLAWEGVRLDLGDGDALALRCAEGASDLVLYLFHGLGGSADSAYIRRAAARFHARGATVVAANHRGAGEGRGLARRPYHMGSTSDVAAVLAWGRARWPGKCHVAVGFSLSANVLLLLLGRDAEAALALPDGAVLVNPPGDTERASRRLVKGFNRVYDLRFLRLLVKLLKEQAAAGLGEGPPPLPRLATLRDFDEAYTARAAGFRDAADYYARSSSAPYLASVGVPMVLISAEDDPFAPASDFEGRACSPHVHLHVERTGGHCGYVARNVPGRHWLDGALDHYVAELRGCAG